MTFWDLVCHAADNEPDWQILADDYGRTLTTAQFREAAEGVAARLPVRAGDVVSWQLPTTLEAAVLMAALSRLDVVQNPLIPVLRHREVKMIAAQLGVSLFIAPETFGGFGYAQMGREADCPVLALDFEGEPGDLLRLPVGDPSALPAPTGVDSSWVYYSSGTTADPKGVRHSDSSLIASANGMIDSAGFGIGDTYPIAWPLTHIGGASMLACALRGGIKLVLFDTWDATTTPLRMAAHAPTVLGSAQPFFRAYARAQREHGTAPLFPRLRAFTAGGAPTPPEVVHELVETFGVSGVPQAYGLTEFPVATAAAPEDPVEILLHSVGRPSPGVDVRIVDGEIRLRGPQCFAGYVDSTLNADAFDVEGWLRTGDIGEIRAGAVYVTGRLKDVIIRNAETISALEVEEVLLRHPDVIDVAVVGLPDPRTGERLCAVVQSRGGKSLDIGTVAEHCRAQGLAKHKWPERVEIVEELERNAMGKLVKTKIRQRVLAIEADQVERLGGRL